MRRPPAQVAYRYFYLIIRGQMLNLVLKVKFKPFPITLTLFENAFVHNISVVYKNNYTGLKLLVRWHKCGTGKAPKRLS